MANLSYTWRVLKEVEADPGAWFYTGGTITHGGSYVLTVRRVVMAAFDAVTPGGSVGVERTPLYPFRVTWGSKPDDAVSILITLDEYRTGAPRDFRRAATADEVAALLAAHSSKTAVRAARLRGPSDEGTGASNADAIVVDSAAWHPGLRYGD